VALQAGLVDEARAGCEELAALAERFGAEALVAFAAQARGNLCLEEGDPAAALGALRHAAHLFQQLQAPYFEACVRVGLARACAELGDDEGAAMLRAAARQAFERLGAAPDLVALAGTCAEPKQRAFGITARELEVLRLVAKGMTNKAIAKQLVVSEKTVDRHVTNLFQKLDVNSRAAATALAYERGLV
jgi:DNA-binding NarL/FixJ family response regulator